MHSFPEDSTFLSDEDKAYILNRLQEDAGKANSNKLSFDTVFSVFKDWQIWCMYTGFCTSIANLDP